jgi:hypothetical protein
LVKRLVAQELTLSFAPDAEQRLWRTVMRRKWQLTRNRVQLHNRLESLLEAAHIKLSSLISDPLGTSGRRMLQALADGETYAKATFRKDRRLNIRISTKDLEAIQKRALEEGLPYQTLIASLLHKYASGRLREA